MKRIEFSDSTNTPGRANSPALSTVQAVVDRHVAELRALAGSPGERAILALIATQAITRGLSVGVAS